MSRRVTGRWTRTRPVSLFPLVQLDLILLDLRHDGVDAGIVFELPETVQVVSIDDLH